MASHPSITDHKVYDLSDTKIVSICLVDLVYCCLWSKPTTNKAVDAVPYNTSTIILLFHPTNATVSLSCTELLSWFPTIDAMFEFMPELHQ